MPILITCLLSFFSILVHGATLNSDGTINPTGDVSGNGGIPAAEAMSSVLIESLPNFSFQPKEHTLTVAGGSFSHTTSKSGGRDPDNSASVEAIREQEVNGFGFALNYTYAFNNRWAFTSTLAYVRGTGTMTENFDTLVNAAHSADRRDEGLFVSVGGVYQFFAKPLGFRLPLAAGIANISVNGGFTMPVTFDVGTRNGNTGSVVEKVDYSIFAPYFGIAPTYAWEKVSLSAFLFFSGAFSERTVTVTQTDDVVGDSATSENVTERGGVQGAGVGLTYLPWDIDLAYTHNLESTTPVSTLMLSWSFKFGGGAEAASSPE